MKFAAAFLMVILPAFSFATSWFTSEGYDGRKIAYPSGWFTSEGYDGRKIAYPSGWFTSEGYDGRKIAYPQGWLTSEGRDGRKIAYPLGWLTSEGRDGRKIAYPLGWFTSEGYDGRKVAYPLSATSSTDMTLFSITRAMENMDAYIIWDILNRVENSNGNSGDSQYLQGYNAGYIAAEQDVTAFASNQIETFLADNYGATSITEAVDSAYANGITAAADEIQRLLEESYGVSTLAEAIINAETTAMDKGIAQGKILGKSEGESLVTSNPSTYGLVTQSAYDEMMNELTSASNADKTPYSEGWFYLPNQGWLWMTRTTYPYFFDSTSKAWMYFQSGNEKPKFYHYGTKTWMTVE